MEKNLKRKITSRCRILGFSHGNINVPYTWSGINHHFFAALKKKCRVVRILNGARYEVIPENKKKKKELTIFSNFKKFIPEYNRLWKKEIKKIDEPYDFILHLHIRPFIKDKVPSAFYIDMVQQDKTMASLYHFTFPEAPSARIPDKVIRRLERHIYHAAARVFTFSQYVKRQIIKYYNIAPQKIIPVGAGPNFSHLPKIENKLYDGKTILFVGTNFQRKGGVTLLEAFKKVREIIPEAKLIIVSTVLKSYIRGNKLQSFNIFIKKFSNKQFLGFLYRRASVFVLPSLYEAFGIAFLEAMAYKLPCIGTNICAMPEIIEDGRTGFLVSPNQPSELAERLIFLLKHPDIARKMGERGYQKLIKYYTWDRVVDRMLPEIEKVLRQQELHKS